MKDFVAIVAVVMPVAACVLMGWRFSRQDKGSWQLAACFAALVIATSIVLLAASERISFVRYGEAVVQVNEKLEETKKLTEQNKRIARLTAELVFHATDGLIASESYNPQPVNERLIALLKEAGFSGQQIEKFLSHTNQTILKIE